VRDQLLVFALLAAASSVWAQSPPVTNGCIECHTVLDDPRITPPAKLFADDVHAKAGFTCVFCHGGDARQESQEDAHDLKKGFIGKPKPQQIPQICGKCHSDPALMKQYDPSQRVDQLSEYWTSGHGKMLAQGDTTVAQCASCHGAHGIQPVKDARSPVSPTRVAQTCNHCHGDAALMAAHKLPSDPYEKWSRSVHYHARVEKGDLSAPTCNSCHGNHGAAPPQVGSVTNVCGTCHVTFADQFKLSPHWEPFKEMGLPGCVTCHENHEIVKPSDAFLAEGDQSKCSSCHEAGSAGASAAAAMRADLVGLDGEILRASRFVDRAAEAGMEVSRVRFDLTSASNALTKARSQVHLFRPSAVHGAVAEGLTIARKAAVGGQARLKERDFRRRGLFVSLGLIVLTMVTLVVRIRERDRSAREPGN
jgi:cytochrome c3-like protein